MLSAPTSIILNNLMWNIINFEVFRALKKKSFWYASIAPVLIILAVLGIEKLSIQNAQKNSATQDQNFTQSAKISVLDDSGLINQQLLAAQHIGIEPSKDAGIAAVKSGQLARVLLLSAKSGSQRHPSLRPRPGH